ncbi:MAG: UDP-glucose 4-epimerase GalE [Cyclobacteriaceae bacterium]
MKVLVTGGTGYIGSHTVVELINAGYDVVIIDNLSNSQKSVVDRIEKITGKGPTLYEFDLCDKEKLEDCLSNELDIGAVVHFAASKAVGESVEQPLLYYSNNLNSTINLIEAIKKYDISNLVFSSSCTVYGQPDVLPVSEQTPFKPAQSPYAYTKQICEQIIRDSVKAYDGIQGLALRYFNPVGAHPSVLIGEFPTGVPNNLVPFITQTAAGLREELKIFGNDYNTPDGTAIRDYIHVVDLAHAHVFAIRRMLNGQTKTNFEYFNIGTGHGYSVLELVLMFEAVNEIKLNYRIVDRRSGDIEKIFADTSLANSELGWQAQHDLIDMMRDAWLWQQSLGETRTSDDLTNGS